MTKHYIATYYVNDSFGEIEFDSDYRAGSKKNLNDCYRAIRSRHGKVIHDLAEVITVHLCRD